MRVRIPLLAAVLAIAACAGSRASQQPGTAASGGGRVHPEVDSGLATCVGCHAQVMPEVAAQWRDGRHGLALVECFVCHGSTGSDFRARPQSSGCGGCHPAQVASLARTHIPPSCFECHPAHSLRARGQPSPHRPAQEARR